MENFEAEISISKSTFPAREQVFIEYNGLKAVLFKYDTGICGVKLSNENGYIIILPFNGQQIWDAVFNNRRLKMESPFISPVNTNNFFYSYGCLFMHCGALRVGSPDSDDFAFHGELPLAEYNDVKILAGNDSRGFYLGLTGVYTYNKAFGYNYCARPLVKLYEGSGIMDISMEIKNLSDYPMELMYLAHINFMPVENGEIMQSIGWNKQNMILRNAIYPDPETGEAHEDFIKKISVDPILTKSIKLSDPYNPAIIFYFNNPRTDIDKWAHFLQIHPDGSADYVSYMPEQLRQANRWIVVNKDYKAISIVNPATCQADGYLKEKEKGNILILEGKNSIEFNVSIGYLNKHETINMKRKIEDIIKE